MSGEQYVNPANIPLLNRYTVETVELFGSTANCLAETQAARNELIERKFHADTPDEATLAHMAIAAVQNQHEFLVSQQPKGALEAAIAREDAMTTAMMDAMLQVPDTTGLAEFEAFNERLARQSNQP
jgi:hypothetical protein